MKICKIISLLTALSMLLVMFCTGAPVSAAETSGVWTGYTYIHGDDTTAVIPDLTIGISNTTDWTEIKYISVDITVAGTVQPVFGASVGGEWTNVNKTISDSTETIYFETDGQTVQYPKLMFWKISDTDYATSGCKITVSNITLSKEEIPAEKGVWYEKDGVYTYTHGDDASVSVPSVPIHNAVADWSGVKYISAKVKVNGSARPVLAGNLNSVWTTGWDEKLTDGEATIYIVTDGKSSDYMTVSFYDIDGSNYVTAGTEITISDIKFSTDEFNYDNIVGRWVNTGDGTYVYNHGNLEASYVWLGKIKPPAEVDISDIQTVTFTTWSAQSNDTQGTVMIFSGETADGEYKSSFSAGATKRTITKYVRGKFTDAFCFSANFVLPGTKLYISDVQFSTTPVEEKAIDPNALIIDESTSDLFKFGDGEIAVLNSHLANIDRVGTLKIYTEIDDAYIDEYNAYQLAWSYPDKWVPVVGHESMVNNEIIEDGHIIEVKIDEALLSEMGKCNLAIQGSYFRYVKTVFTPDVDTPAPEMETVVPEAEIKTELDKEFTENKQSIKPESGGPKKGSDMNENKLYIQKSNVKQHGGKRVHAYRFVKKLRKSDITDLKNVSLFLGVDGKYVELKTNCAFSSLNINGAEVEAGSDYVFVVFILDNVPENREFSFSDFKCNK